MLPSGYRGLPAEILEQHGHDDPLLKELEGIKTQTQFAQRFGIKDLGTLTDWNRKIDWEAARNRYLGQIVMRYKEYTVQVLEALRMKAIGKKSGASSSAKLWLQFVEGWDPRGPRKIVAVCPNCGAISNSEISKSDLKKNEWQPIPKRKRRLYLIGGYAKAGKSYIREKIEEHHKLIPLTREAILAGLRSVLVGEDPKTFKQIVFEAHLKPFDMISQGKVEGDLLAPIVIKDETKDDLSLISVETDGVRGTVNQTFFMSKAGVATANIKVLATTPTSEDVRFESGDQGEDYFAWKASLGLIKYYDHHRMGPDLLLEGVAITPENISDLELKNFEIRPIFIGYSSPSHAQARIDYAKKVKEKSYVYRDILTRGEEAVRRDVERETTETIPLNKLLRSRAEKLGYRYFDLLEEVDPNFEKRADEAVKFILQGE